MIGERETKHTNTEYGALSMRSYKISGNDINAFYDDSGELVFVLDNTISNLKPNVLLVINPDGDRKWDEILSNDYDVDLETIRPKQDNKYQKLDIEYSGLNVYDNLINAYDDGGDISDLLDQLNVLRDSAARHSAMVRLTAANEIIAKTNATIVKTKETIVRLTERIKALRAKLSATKKEIGRVSTKQSASKILKLESQIEAANEKLKRAKKRLESAQKRLETATVDAELAEELLNQPTMQNKPATKKRTTKSKSVVVAPKHAVQRVEPEEDDEEYESDDADDKEYNDEYESDEESDDEDEEIEDDTDDDDVNAGNGVKPLLNDDPQILDEDIAFKPISFNAPNAIENQKPVAPELPKPEPTPHVPDLNNVFFAPEVTDAQESTNEKPVLESMTPIDNVPEIPQQEPIDDTILPEPTNERPVLESMTPIDNVPETQPVERPAEIPVLNDTFNAPEIKTDVEPVEDNRPVLETMTPEVRQSEPVYNENMERPAGPMPVINDKLVTPMTESMHEEIMHDDGKRKPTPMYYILLIVLILLSVFTLWLYQKSTNPTDTVPMLTANVETTTVSKKTEKPAKVVKPVVTQEQPPVEDDFEFLDADQPTTDDNPEEVEPEPVIDEQPVDTEPVVIDAVPARLNTSGSVNEDESEPALTEQDVLASKPVYEPGARHNEMFVVDDADVSDQDYEIIDSEEVEDDTHYTEFAEPDSTDESYVDAEDVEETEYADDQDDFLEYEE